MGRPLGGLQGKSAFSKKGSSMNRVIKRMAKEPSSWAGIAALLGALRMALPAYAGLLDGIIMVSGALAVGMKEQGKP
jgi:hypothetical protein